MSFQAMAWAVKQSPHKPQEKFVLIMLANYANESGQCWPKVKRIAHDTGLSSDTVRRSIKGLVEQGMIETEERFKDGVQLPHRITLLEGTSQGQGVYADSEGGTCSQRGGSMLPARGVYADSITEPINEPINEPKKEKVCAVADATRTDRQPEELFEEFWQAFPPDRRRGKGKTRQAFAKAKASPETIIQAVRDGRGIDPACPPMPITWLNQGRWEDDPHQTKQSDGLPAWKAEKMRKAKEFYELCGGVIANG